MIQIEFLTIDTARCCGGASGRFNVRGRVTAHDGRDVHDVSGSGVNYTLGSGPVTLHGWIYDNEESASLWEGFPLRVVVTIYDQTTHQATTASVHVTQPMFQNITIPVGSIVVTAQMHVPVRSRNGTNRGDDGHFNFGHQQPADVFLFRSLPPTATIEDGGEYQTVSMQWRRIRAEIYPVFPHGLSAIQRPAWAIADGGQEAADANEDTSTALNMVSNPSVIPILTNPTADTAAELRITSYFPRGLGFTATDPRLRWNATSLAGGAAVTFVPNGGSTDTGTSVRVAGTAAGEVKVELLFNEFVIGVYRALVRPLVRIPYRVVLLHAPGVPNLPQPADLVNDMARVNRILRQVAIELVPDTSAPGGANISTTSAPGIFIAHVGRNDTVGVPMARASAHAAPLDARPNIVNFAVVHSKDGPGTWLAFASRWPETTGPNPVTDTGVPGTSWIGSSGIEPLNTPATSSINVMAARISSRATDPKVTLAIAHNGNYQNRPIYRAGTIAHELCHGLNLNHRAPTTVPAPGRPDPFPDGLTAPGLAALMHPVGLAESVFIDIIQARAIWASHFVTHYQANPLP
ncbi:MAG: hypothetical protein U0414_42255 [Polyangiaceae bacterium]